MLHSYYTELLSLRTLTGNRYRAAYHGLNAAGLVFAGCEEAAAEQARLAARYAIRPEESQEHFEWRVYRNNV